MNVDDPVEMFARWLADARAAGVTLSDAMALATADSDGMPDARMVMVRRADCDGLVFFTDRASAKGDQLRANPHAVLLGYWRELGRQVRVGGTVEQTSPAEDDAVFSGRPRQVQIAVAAWRQGARIGDPDKLRAKFEAAEERFREVEVPRPARWGGYRLVPARFVFWQERADRLHHRQEYVRRADGGWHRRQLAP